jgi:Transaldolase
LTKIFCDIADIKLIRNFNKKKIVKGFTTNPTLMRKAGAEHYSKYSKKILKITKKPISFEVFADDIKNMILQGVEISKWGKNVYVKVPITNSKGRFMGKSYKKFK